jgi:AmiR/NasT family two-component response regulator
VGVLNVYGTDQGAFDEHAVLVGGLVAAAVTAVLQDVEEKLALQTTTGNLEEALRSRAVIEQAKGIVMAHHGGSPDEAFARLVKLSNQHNVKVRDLAGLLVEGGAASGLRPWMSEPG